MDRGTDIAKNQMQELDFSIIQKYSILLIFFFLSVLFT